MCAIAGILDLPFDSQILDKMLSTMLHRGPDGTGTYMEKQCCLLHSRLAIIDPEGGAQPMSLYWGSEEYVITYNGELYNTSELKSSLIALGHEFITHSDTEVVLHAYAQWKDACVDKLNGIFAFGVWEKRRKRLFLARDRVGVKPLFYTQVAGGLLFSSEIKTLLAYPNVPRELDAEGAAQILLLGPGRKPDSGVFRNILALMPGYCGYYEAGSVRVWQYWKLLDREHRDSFEETAECVRFLVTDAIQRQMVSDVPIGTFLSGGLDSSLITAICSGEMKKRGEVLDTFSVDYENNDRYFTPGKFQPNSDNSYIALMQEKLQSNHHWTVLNPDDLISEMENATIARDLPGMADVDFSLLAFCRKIRQNVKMALSGECADEIFGGYPWFRDPEVRDANGFPWAQNTSQRADFLHPDIKIDPVSFVNDQYMQTISQCDILPNTPAQEKRIKEMVNLNQIWFMQTLLDRKDRMSMACGLEVRVPFCDYRIAEYMYGVPWEYKDYKNKEKGLLRYAMEGILPEDVLWRKKSPYPKTFDPAYFDKVSLLLKELLKRNDAPIYALVNKNALEKLINSEFVWPWYGQLMKVPQTIAYMLQINFWLEHYKIRVV
ncbi:MAG: asparagine synthase (glutamine-hydrolyzing) [Ruminococcaceae bacterium]|nr:asparagine synthase (glutamine-hydrolyzing) [Oscillospiraceae bacterium]